MTISFVIKTGFSYWQKNPLQLFISITGIMLGVGVVTAIDLTNYSALESFKHSVVTVSGKTTHRLTSKYGTLDERKYFFIRNVLGIKNSAPIIEGFVKTTGKLPSPLKLFLSLIHI